LYYYDAIARLQDAQLSTTPSGNKDTNIGQYIRLGPLGTAMYPQDRPRVLLIDEIDKSDIDLPNDLLNLLEEGYFEIRQLTRLKWQKKDNQQPTDIETYDGDWRPDLDGKIGCQQFPIVIMTSNGERDFPLPFKRRCLPLSMSEPNAKDLAAIIQTHFDKQDLNHKETELINKFVEKRRQGPLANDQLLNILFMLTTGQSLSEKEEKRLTEILLTFLTEDGPNLKKDSTSKDNA
jgi:hypothetical protein